MARARRLLAPKEQETHSRPQYWGWRGAIYNHPNGITNETIPYVDASPRYLAVPPVDGTLGPNYGFAARSTQVPDPPSAVQLYRDSDWWITFDQAIDTQNGARVPGGVAVTIAINPGVATIGFVSTVNTDKAVINWMYGRGEWG